MSVYLFDMGGGAIAFRRAWNDPYLFDLDGHWIGHCAWGDNDVVDPGGRYLGSVVSDRLVRRNDWDERPCRTTVADPGLSPAPAGPERRWRSRTGSPTRTC